MAKNNILSGYEDTQEIDMPISIEDIVKQYGTKDKVVSLLQVDSFMGNSKKSSKKVILTVLVACIPILFLLQLWGLVSLVVGRVNGAILVLILYAIYVWQVVAHIALNQTERINDYLRQQRKKYTPFGRMINIKEIIGNIINYINRSTIIIECYNGAQDSDVKKQMIQQFLDVLYNIDDIQFEIRVVNDVKKSIEFEPIYKNIRSFPDKETAKQIIDMLRENESDVYQKSRIQKTLYIIRCQHEDAQQMVKQLENILPSQAYYKCYIANEQQLKDILEYDSGIDLNENELRVQAYADEDMGDSKLLFKRVDDTKDETKKYYKTRRN